MAHELTTNNLTGQIEFAYRESEGLPWHGLGQPMPDDASIDQWRVAAGMDWKIKRAKVRYPVSHDPSVPLIEIPDQHVLFRSDTKNNLAIVSDRYKVVQPAEVIDFFRDIAQAGGLELSAAGTIQGGRKFWATAKIGEASPTSVKDSIGGYLLLSTSADGSMPTEARLTSIRAVCANTLAFAREDSKAAMRISHRSKFDAADIKDQMGLNLTAWNAFRADIMRLANTVIRPDHAEELVADLFTVGEGSKDKVRESRGYEIVLRLFNGAGKGSTLDGVAGTAWGLLNAATEYADHHTRTRTQENQFISSHFGPAASFKQQAFDKLLALATA